MRKAAEAKAVERSCRLYQRLLVLYPRNHREEYGAAISQLFRDQCRDAWTEARMRGLTAFWCRALMDLLKTSLSEHLSNLNQTMLMLSTFRPRFTPLSVFLPVFAAAFLLALIGSTVITFLLPETYVSTARVSLDLSYPPGSFSGASFLETEFQIIRSHIVLTKTIDALNLREIWGRKYYGGAPMSAPKAEALLRHSLDLQPVRNTTLIEIRAFSDNPNEAARLANGVAEAYRQYSQDRHLELERRDETTNPVTRAVTIIDPAMPEMRPIAPNKPLNITFGIIVGLLLGFISGGISAGFIVWKRTNDNPSDSSTLATPSAPAAFDESAPAQPGPNLLIWIIGYFWISVSITFTVLILSFMLEMGSAPGGGTLVPVLFLLLEASGVLTAMAGFSLLRGKLWAKIYITIAALVIASWSVFGSLFPIHGPFRWLFAAFGLASLCVLFFPRAILCRAQTPQARLS